MKRLLDRLFGKAEEINGLNRCETYLYRWVLFHLPNGVAAYLHHFVADDWSRDFHDHPKRFISIGLKGGYVEETPSSRLIGLAKRRTFRAPWIRTFPATHQHRLRMLRPGATCWTLIIVGKTEREWGFWPDGKWMKWSTYARGPAGDRGKACP